MTNLNYEKLWKDLFAKYQKEMDDKANDNQFRLLCASIVADLAGMEHDGDYEIK